MYFIRMGERKERQGEGERVREMLFASLVFDLPFALAWPGCEACEGEVGAGAGAEASASP